MEKNVLGMFKNYFTDNHTYFDSCLAFRSALPKEIFFENSMPEPDAELFGYYNSNHYSEPSGWQIEGGEEAYNKAMENWQTAQQNITEKLLILKKL